MPWLRSVRQTKRKSPRRWRRTMPARRFTYSGPYLVPHFIHSTTRSSALTATPCALGRVGVPALAARALPEVVVRLEAAGGAAQRQRPRRRRHHLLQLLRRAVVPLHARQLQHLGRGAQARLALQVVEHQPVVRPDAPSSSMRARSRSMSGSASGQAARRRSASCSRRNRERAACVVHGHQRARKACGCCASIWSHWPAPPRAGPARARPASQQHRAGSAAAPC